MKTPTLTLYLHCLFSGQSPKRLQSPRRGLFHCAFRFVFFPFLPTFLPSLSLSSLPLSRLASPVSRLSSLSLSLCLSYALKPCFLCRLLAESKFVTSIPPPPPPTHPLPTHHPRDRRGALNDLQAALRQLQRGFRSTAKRRRPGYIYIHLYIYRKRGI